MRNKVSDILSAADVIS